MFAKFLTVGFTILLSLLIAACGSADEEIVETVVVIEEAPQAVVVETVAVEDVEESGENIIFENWIAPELEVEIMIETDSSQEQSSVRVEDRDGRVIETISGDTAFGTIWSLAPGDRVVMDCRVGVRCTHEVKILSKTETFIDRTEMDCNRTVNIYSHGLDSDLDLIFVLEDQCEDGGGMYGGIGISVLRNDWVDENGNKQSNEIYVFDNSKTTYTKTVKKGQRDSFIFMCCGNSGECYYEVSQLVK